MTQSDTKAKPDGETGLQTLYENFHGTTSATDWQRTSSGKLKAWKQCIEYIPAGIFVDLGCGDGSVTEVICAWAGGNCIALDISHEAAKQAKLRGLNIITCDIAQRLPLADSTIDHIFCSDFIEHIVDVDSFLDEVTRVLKPGGYCVLSTPNLAWLPNRLLLLLGLHPLGDELSYRYDISAWFKSQRKFPAGHIHVFSQRALITLLKLHGFKVEKSLGAQMIEAKTLKRWEFPKFANAAILIDRFCSLRSSWSWEMVIKIRKTNIS